MMICKNAAKLIRKIVIESGETKTICIGRSRNTAGAWNGTPIVVIPGDSEPRLAGLPCLGTTFRNGAFTKNLYTPSTLRIEIGEDCHLLKQSADNSELAAC